MDTLPLSIKESLEMVVCLDALGTPGAFQMRGPGGAGGPHSLYLHVSKPPKTPAVQAAYKAFEDAAAAIGVPLEVVQKKVRQLR